MSTMTSARGYRNIAESSKAWENTAPPTLLLTRLSANFPHRPGVCPLGCGGAGIALPLPFSQVLVPPVPSTCVLFRYSHSLSTSSSSDSVTASNLEPLTFSEEAPSPCTQNHPFLWALPALGGFPKSCQSSVYSASTED